MTDDVTRILRDAYDRRVEQRAVRPAPVWETAERDIFLEALRRERATSVLELGAATGSDAAFFKAHGFEVVCVDLSPKMVERCRARGLAAHVMDVADLRFPPDSFAAVYAMNCLVHVPKTQLRGVLEGVRRVVKPGGLFYLGLYGGRDFEGVADDDDFQPKRFFSHHPDEDLRAAVLQFFSLESFRCIPHGWNGLHFQSLILRRPITPVETCTASAKKPRSRHRSRRRCATRQGRSAAELRCLPSSVGGNIARAEHPHQAAK
jgi:SAM-dependent methyltransferase